MSGGRDRIVAVYLTLEELRELATVDEIPDGARETHRWRIRESIAEKARRTLALLEGGVEVG